MNFFAVKVKYGQKIELHIKPPFSIRLYNIESYNITNRRQLLYNIAADLSSVYFKFF